MTYLDDAAIREQVWHAYNTRATAGAHDNRPLLAKILELRQEKARLLGFRDFADLVLDDRMAHTGARAQTVPRRPAREDRAALPRRESGAGGVRRDASCEPWDIGYWAEKQRAALYDFDEEALRPYFPLERVVDGMFEIFGRMFGIRVTRRNGRAGLGPGRSAVTRFMMRASGRASRFLLRRLVSARKQARRRVDGFADHRQSGRAASPHLGLICGNLTPPVDGKPALLTHREVETIFHEFGHLLHHLLSRVEVRSLAGTSVAWDFVELPSQIMENWCWERESLDLFARHWETGEPIPEDLFQKMKRAKTFRAANAQMRQLGFGFVDLALHREWDGHERRGRVSRARFCRTFAPAPLPDDYAMIAGFTHLFASPVGYGAGYYSYKWAEVLDADAFTRFRKEGVFSEAVGPRLSAKRFWRAAIARIRPCCTVPLWAAIRTRTRCWSAPGLLHERRTIGLR